MKVALLCHEAVQWAVSLFLCLVVLLFWIAILLFGVVLVASLAYAQEPVRINCGGSSVIDGSNLWRADMFYSEGTVWTSPTALDGILPVYSTMRYGNFVYQFPVPDGTWTVTLKFAETSTAITGTGQRKFNVNINGQTVLSNYDIAADVGLRVPVDKTFEATASGTNGVRVQFTTVLRNAIVSAIEVVPKSRSVSQAPSCPGPTFTVQNPKTLIVGITWTVLNPCYIHQALTPLGTDPLFVAKLTAPVILQISNNVSADDDVFVWYRSPSATQPARMEVAVSAANFSSLFAPTESFATITHSTPFKTFAPGSNPVGIAYVRSGQWLPLKHEILTAERAVYIDGTTPIAVNVGDGGLTLVLNPAAMYTARLQQTQAELVESTARAMKARLDLPLMLQVDRLEASMAASLRTMADAAKNEGRWTQVLLKQLEEMRSRVATLESRRELETKMRLAGGQ